MNATELKLPDGTLAGYACSSCGKPKTTIQCKDRQHELAMQREQAEQCCVCNACGQPVGQDRAGWYIHCKPCDDARWTAIYARADDPEVKAERERQHAAETTILSGPCPDGEAILRKMHASFNDYDNDLTTEQCAACRVGAEAIAELASLKANSGQP